MEMELSTPEFSRKQKCPEHELQLAQKYKLKNLVLDSCIAPSQSTLEIGWLKHSEKMKE